MVLDLDLGVLFTMSWPGSNTEQRGAVMTSSSKPARSVQSVSLPKRMRDRQFAA